MPILDGLSLPFDWNFQPDYHAHGQPLPLHRLWRLAARRRLMAVREVARALAGRHGQRDHRNGHRDLRSVLSVGQRHVGQRDKRRDLFRVGGKYLYVDGWFIIGAFHQLWVSLLDRTQVTSVLEVGAGRGTNVALLALRRPQLRVAGLELTRAGVERSRELAADPPPAYLAIAGTESLSPEQRSALARAQFHQGSAFEMPFEDKSFDLSFTCLALEQMPADYPRVLREMWRTTRKYCAFLEPFREANGLLGRAYLRGVDYFRASYRVFADFGLEPVHFTSEFPQKTNFGTGLLLTRVLD